jgi:peptide/nickel transport system substrate-binding protein
MIRRLAFVLALGLVVFAAGASAKSFRWANDGDVSSMDPYGRNETLLLSFLGNVYEPLFRRDADLKLEPALAVSSSQPAPDIWRFQLRRGVTFQDGTSFGADDVLFSATRARHPNSRMNTKLARVKEIRKIDDYTVDFVTNGPDPILREELSDWYIMSKTWSEKNSAVEPADLSKLQEGYASRNANGTGPFMLKERQPDVKTVLVPNAKWWDKPKHTRRRACASSRSPSCASSSSASTR